MSDVSFVNMGSPTASQQNTSLARWLSSLSIALLLVFLAGVLIAAVPARLLDPAWQLQTISVVISNGMIPLVGVLLMRLALWIDPNNGQIRSRTLLLRRWAFVAALGFLLLVPLQGIAAWKTLTTATGIQEHKVSQVSNQLSELRASIAAATSPRDLQDRLKRIPGLPEQSLLLSATDLDKPMPMLREDLRGQLQQAENMMMPQLNAALALKAELLLKDSLRITLTALAYAFAFASGSLRRPAVRLPFTGLRTRSRRDVAGNYYLQLARAEQAPLS